MGKKSVKKQRYKLQDGDISAYLMLVPTFALFAIFTIYPILWALRYMFYEYDGVSEMHFIGLENFIRVFTRDPEWWKSVSNTFLFASGKLIIEIPLALVLAFLLTQKIKGKGFFRCAYFMPTVTSAAVMGLVFSFLFSSYNGIANTYLEKLGIISKSLEWLADKKLAMLTVIIVSVWQNFGQNVILLMTGLLNIPEEIYESAKIDGANKTQSFFKITLPMLAPMLQLVLMLAIIGSLQSFDSIFVLTGGGPDRATEIMGIAIYNKFFASTGVVADYGYGATLAFVSAVIIGIFTVIYMKLTSGMKDADGK